MDYETPIHYDMSSPTTVQTSNEPVREQNSFTQHMSITSTTAYNSELNVLYVHPQATLNHPLREEVLQTRKPVVPKTHPKQKIIGKSVCSKVEKTYQCMRSARQNRLF